jgi:predicted AAA+ superfamily ATPase
VPLAPQELALQGHLADLAGRIAESVLGSYLLTIGGLALSHFPARPNEPEVDFVVTAGAQRIPIEVKYRARIDSQADTEGLRSFIEKAAYKAPFGILVTQGDVEVDDPRIISVPLPSILMMK